jgi:hypothetical protein
MPAFKVLKKAIIDTHKESLANTNVEQADDHRSILNHLCAEVDRMDKATYRNPTYNTYDLMKKLFTKLGDHFPISAIFENEMSKIFYDVANELEDMILAKVSTVMIERSSTTIPPRNSVFAPKPVAIKIPTTIHTDLNDDRDKVMSPFTL